MFELAASYVGAVVGAGFASGQEQVLFLFPIHFQPETGPFPLGSGVFFAGGLFVLFGAALGELVFTQKTSSPRDFLRQLIPWPLWVIYDGLMTLFIYWSVSIMFAGSGMLFKQSMGLSRMTGIILTAMVTIFATVAGVDGLLTVNLIMSPFMLAMPIVVAVLSIYKRVQGFRPLMGNGIFKTTLSSALTFSWPLSVLLYVSYNVLLAVGIFASMGRDIPDSGTARRGGILGGIALMFFLVAIQSVLVAYGKPICNEELPMLKAASYHGSLIAGGYSLALWFSMATTSICGVFTLSQRLSKHLPVSKASLITAITAMACLPAQLGFAKLVGTVYPIIGYAGLPVLALVLLQFLKTHMTNR